MDVQRSDRKLKGHSRSKRSSRAYDAGFTLVEMLVVLAIIGMVAALATPQVLKYLASAKVTATQVQLKNIGNALELYFLDNGRYPASETGLSALVTAPSDASGWNGPYLRGRIEDAWGNAFRYEAPAAGGAKVISFGRDGKPQGEGPDADLEYSTE